MTIQPGRDDIKIYQGATFREHYEIQDEDENPLDFTGYTARAMAREDYDSETPFMDLTTENDGITLGGEDGTIDLYMSAEDTEALTVEGGVWDLELIAPNGDVERILQGKVCVSKGVTYD